MAAKGYWREISAVLVLKTIGIVLLYFLFVAPSAHSQVTPAKVAAASGAARQPGASVRLQQAMSELSVVDLSRLQFALTAMYHFLFVPLTIGLSLLIAIMESVYVMTRREIWREMTKFWGLLFGINFAMGVATGITMEFQFGTNWAYYAHYVGDIFGAPLAIEGLMAFFLEASFVGLFFFGWNRLSRVEHLVVTWLVALGSNLSALWILIANGWMQNPVGAVFNPATMRMEVTLVLRRAVQSGGPGEIRPHGQRRLCHRRDLRHGGQRLVPAARAQSRISPSAR